MVESLADQIIRKVKKAELLYHRLVLVIAPSGSGKTRALQEVQSCLGITMVNVNLELSRRMLELTARQRVLQLPRLLQDIVHTNNDDLMLFDNIEIIFDVNLKHDPLGLLKGLSRNKTLVAAWNGNIEGGFLTYASPDHPEYQRYPIQDFLVASL
jgi:ABC-type uncharacterized transport system ATPase component